MKLTTGVLTNLSDDNSDIATFCIPNKAVEIKVIGDFRELERKLWVYLIHRAYEKNNLQIGDFHEISCDELVLMFQKCSFTKDPNRIWSSIKRLTDIKVTLKSGEDIEGFSSLISCSVIDYKNRIIRYQIPRMLEEFYLNQDTAYSRLRTKFLLGLKGKYACTLYMMMERYVNRHSPTLKISIDDLRSELKVSEGKMSSWTDFKRRVLEPAIQEIHKKTFDNSHLNYGAGFNIHYQVITGKKNKVTHLVLSIEKTQARFDWDQMLKSRKNNRVVHTTSLKENPTSPTFNLDWEKVGAILQKRSIHCDKYAYFKEWEKWLKDTNKFSSLKTPEFSYVGFVANKVMFNSYN